MHLSVVIAILPLALGARVPGARLKREETVPVVASDQNSQTIAGKYIVKFKDGTHPSIRDGFLGGLSGETDHVYDGGFHGFAGTLSDAELESIRNHEHVDYIEPDRIVSGFGSIVEQDNAEWGLGRISHKKRGAAKYVYDDSAGEGTCAYVVDSGVDDTHPEFGGRAKQVKSFIDGEKSDGHGHGTHVAGIIGSNTYGVAKKTKIFGVKVLDNTNRGPVSGLIAGLNFIPKDVAKRKCPKGVVVNFSTGIDYSQAMNDAARHLIATGVFFGAAAGNFGQDAGSYSPASIPGVCVVGGIGKDDKLYESGQKRSNHGSVVDIYAPGKSIVSTQTGGGLITMSGTSQATPFVVGLAAYLGSLEGLSGTKALCDRIVKMSTKNAIINMPKGSHNRIAFNGATQKKEAADSSPKNDTADNETTLPGVTMCANDSFGPPCTEVDAPYGECVAVPKDLMGKVSFLKLSKSAGTCRFYMDADCKGDSFEKAHTEATLYGSESHGLQVFNDKISSFSCKEKPPSNEPNTADRWVWSSRTQQNICSHVEKLQFGIQLSSAPASGTWDTLKLEFSGEGAVMHTIAEGPSAGFHEWQPIEMKKMFNSDTVEVGRIRKVRLVEVSTSWLGGDEWTLVGIKFKGQCAGTNVTIENNKFASIDKSLHIEASYGGKPWQGRDYSPWEGSTGPEDWESKPPCSHFWLLSINLEVADKFLAGTGNDLYAYVGKGRFPIARHPSRGEIFTVTVDLQKAFGSSEVALSDLQSVSITSEGGKDQVLPQKTTLHGVCAGSSVGAQVQHQHKTDDWIADGGRWTLNLTPQMWSKL